MKLQPASVFRRLLATLTDVFILSLATGALLWLAGILIPDNPGRTLLMDWVAKPAASLAAFLGVIIFPLYRWGYTPGKKALGLRLMFLGSQGSLSDILGREVAAKALSLVTVIGALLAFGSSRLALHDRIMKTQVLEEID
jgi:uncharacterized RDD family membrane protein YckC